MCFAVPMQIVSIVGHLACCEAKGVRRDVSLTLLAAQDVTVGDHVLVHVGYAVQSITAAEASRTWELFDQIASAIEQASA